MIQRTKIAMLMSGEQSGQEVCARGWVRTKRESKTLCFINLNDGSNQAGVQIIVDSGLENYSEVQMLTTGAGVEVIGKLVASPGQGQAYEIQAIKFHVYGVASGEEYPLQKKGHTLEYLREIAHLRPRTNTFGAVFRIRNALAYAVHRFFQERGFIYIQTPIITDSDAEGAGSLFRVTTFDLNNLPRDAEQQVDDRQDFFGKAVNLTVSGQLEAETFATALSDVYTFGPTFRAENSHTSRHLAEFWMLEPEMAFCDLSGDADLAEEFLKYLLTVCLDQHEDELVFLQKFYDKNLIRNLESIVKSKFKRISYTEAVRILENSNVKFEFPVEWGKDLQSEHERYLTEKYFNSPLIVIDYPKEIKAFYMRQNDDGKTVAAMDVLFPGIGEIIGGAQRDEREDHLVQRMNEAGLSQEDYWWYLDLRRYGSVPHSGFGLGFERFVQFVTAMGNIRDVIPFPRVPGSASF